MHQAYLDWKYCLKIDEDNNMPIHVAVLNDDCDMLRRHCIALKARNISIDTMDGENMTALQLAAYSGFTQCIHILLEQGADVLVRTDDGQTLLHIAAEGDMENIAVLLDHCVKHARSLLKECEELWKPEMECKPEDELAMCLLQHLSTSCDEQDPKISNETGVNVISLLSDIQMPSLHEVFAQTTLKSDCHTSFDKFMLVKTPSGIDYRHISNSKQEANGTLYGNDKFIKNNDKIISNNEKDVIGIVNNVLGILNSKNFNSDKNNYDLIVTDDVNESSLNRINLSHEANGTLYGNDKFIKNNDKIISNNYKDVLGILNSKNFNSDKNNYDLIVTDDVNESSLNRINLSHEANGTLYGNDKFIKNNDKIISNNEKDVIGIVNCKNVNSDKNNYDLIVTDDINETSLDIINLSNSLTESHKVSDNLIKSNTIHAGDTAKTFNVANIKNVISKCNGSNTSDYIKTANKVTVKNLMISDNAEDKFKRSKIIKINNPKLKEHRFQTIKRCVKRSSENDLVVAEESKVSSNGC
ncbi:unnamed protein product [Leptidea sinapis]|uniref:Uncharacterized protein n=1 Tax=Leptidea sinapis TaxID=189913 RepID=A0A5E4QSC8_9NEOP|nr:unnamed protein product [Leptidea sinapis]